MAPIVIVIIAVLLILLLLGPLSLLSFVLGVAVGYLLWAPNAWQGWGRRQ